MNAPRMPEVGERVRVKLRNGAWIWTDVIHVYGNAIGCGFDGVGGLFRHSNGYGITWRFPEDDPEGCAQRPAIKDDE